MQVLLLGGHGKVAMHLTPLLLNRAWNVTSVIRNPEHENDIRPLAQGKKGKLDVLLSSLDDVKSEADAGKSWSGHRRIVWFGWLVRRIPTQITQLPNPLA